MKNDNGRKEELVFCLCGIIPVIWSALLTAPYISGGIIEITSRFPEALNHPFQITICRYSIKAVLIYLFAYGMGIGVYYSTRRNYRKGEEHGSAKWGGTGTVNKKYRDKDPAKNKLLTQNVRIGLDGKKHLSLIHI